MYIYPSSPESASSLQSEESAAIKIQAGFRGYRVRKQLYRLNSSSSSSNRSKGRQSSSRPSALRRQQQQQQRAMEERLQQEGGQQTADGQTVEDRCATKIQAGFRGFLVRKKQKIATDAAVKIQSSFRGFKARKEAEKMKQT